MIVIDAVPKKLYWYRLYCDGVLLEAACAPRILTLTEEIALYESWAHKFGAPTFEGFTNSIAVREMYANETGAQRKMREADEDLARRRYEAQRAQTEESHRRYQEGDFTIKPRPFVGMDPGAPGGDWSAFWFRRGK